MHADEIRHLVIMTFVSSPVWAPAVLADSFGIDPKATAGSLLALLIVILLLMCSRR